MDAEALYPSLNIEDIMTGIWELCIETDLDLNKFDYRELQVPGTGV